MHGKMPSLNGGGGTGNSARASSGPVSFTVSASCALNTSGKSFGLYALSAAAPTGGITGRDRTVTSSSTSTVTAAITSKGTSAFDCAMENSVAGSVVEPCPASSLLPSSLGCLIGSPRPRSDPHTLAYLPKQGCCRHERVTLLRHAPARLSHF